MQDIDKNLNSGPLAFKLKKCVDPRVDTEELNSIDNEYIGYVGAQNWNRYSIPATVWNNSEVKFTNIQSPGPNVLWDKKWWIEYCINLDIKNIPATGNSGTGFIGSDPAIFFRPYPIHQTTNTIQIRINNRDIQSYPMDTLNARMEYWPQDKLKLSCGCCPHRKYNGQTFADCSIRAGNSPYGDMKEFTDQDYPNSTVCNIEELTFTKGEILEKSNFEREAPMKGYRVTLASAVNISANTAVDKNTVNAVLAKYNDLVNKFAADVIQKSKDDGGKYGGIISHTNLLTEKKAFTGEKGGGYSILTANVGANGANYNPQYNATFAIGTYLLDADFLTQGDLSVLDGVLVKSNSKAIVYWSGAAYDPEKMGSYHLRVRIREPIIAEPLDFTSSSDFGRSMWNISAVEVRFSFDNYMKNMIAIDRYKLEKNAEWYWAFETIRSLYLNEDQNILNDSNINISFVEAPRLIYNIATPFVPPNCPFICAHKQFQIFESHLDNKLNGSEIKRDEYKVINNNTKKITTVSDAYPLQFHPNALYLWVAERKTDRYDAKNRYTRVDSYAKINGIRITYGNTSNILAQFDDHELFQMSLRNGLKDRTFLDWNAVPKSICVPLDYNGADTYYGVGGTVPVYTSTATTTIDSAKHYFASSTVNAEDLITYQRYAGIGSVIKLIPGIDILTGDTTNPLVAGMHAYSATIKIEVDFTPLNLNEDISYSLYTMFEYDGVCTISAQSCDLGMIAIESWAQLKATPKARTVREDAYGSGLGGSTLNWLRKARAMASNFRSKFDGKGYGAGAINGNSLTSVMEGGRLISPSELNARFGKGHGGSFYKPY